MKRYDTRGIGWKKGTLLVIAATLVGLILGLLVDAVTDRASSVEPSPSMAQAPPKDENHYSKVKNKRQGARKARRGKLGHARADLRYTRQTKRKIVNALKRAEDARVAGTSTEARTRKQLWAAFRSQDNCMWKWSPVEGADTPDYWTCKRTKSRRVNLNGHEVYAMFCNGGAAIAIVKVTGFWGWAGIGFGWVACTWAPILAEAADRE